MFHIIEYGPAVAPPQGRHVHHHASRDTEFEAVELAKGVLASMPAVLVESGYTVVVENSDTAQVWPT